MSGSSSIGANSSQLRLSGSSRLSREVRSAVDEWDCPSDKTRMQRQDAFKIDASSEELVRARPLIYSQVNGMAP